MRPRSGRVTCPRAAFACRQSHSSAMSTSRKSLCHKTQAACFSWYAGSLSSQLSSDCGHLLVSRQPALRHLSLIIDEKIGRKAHLSSGQALHARSDRRQSADWRQCVPHILHKLLISGQSGAVRLCYFRFKSVAAYLGPRILLPTFPVN